MGLPSGLSAMSGGRCSLLLSVFSLPFFVAKTVPLPCVSAASLALWLRPCLCARVRSDFFPFILAGIPASGLATGAGGEI